LDPPANIRTKATTNDTPATRLASFSRCSAVVKAFSSFMRCSLYSEGLRGSSCWRSCVANRHVSFGLGIGQFLDSTTQCDFRIMQSGLYGTGTEPDDLGDLFDRHVFQESQSENPPVLHR